MNRNTTTRFITALGTPLTEDECLHEEGLERQLADQWAHGFEGVLVAGTMGAMQLLTDETYRRLVGASVSLSQGRGEVLIGAGDAGFSRSRDRIRFINDYAVDGVAVLAPFFWSFSQANLIPYYQGLADESKAPLYLYDLPQVTGTKLEMDTILTLAKHPNIKGIKVSCDFSFTRQMMDRLDDPGFRVIVAQPDLVDVLLRSGVREHLDGMWAICPGWTLALRTAASRDDWDEAARRQQAISHIRGCLARFGFSVFTELMNARGIPGRFTPRPHATLSADQRAQLFDDPTVAALVHEDPAAG